MTFQDAKAALKAMAAGKYHAIKYELTEYADNGGLLPECSVYIDGFGHSQSFTNFELALANMEAKIKQKDNPHLVEEMTPDIDLLAA